ncbi:MAG: ABC transporter ATP-binding protein [Thermoguttaceae bacterium]|jgi:ABC-type multidrug transport system ATPase subunit|nr:ABC transporter ATP-binding protein [Thermoguttaceae bacterium]
MIRLIDVVQHYGVRPVLKRINLEIRSGELTVILGPNGMGKTTLLATMAGVLTPQRGVVEIDGLRRRSSVEDELEIRKRVVYLPDHPWLPKNRTGREFLLAVGRLYEIEENRLIDRAERLLHLFDLGREADWPIRSYSNGQQKKVAVGAALITEAPILLLDEPFSGGLDPAGILVLKRVLRRLATEKGATVVMTTPVPELIEELADRIVVLQHGEVLAHDTPEALRQRTQCPGPLASALEKLIHPQTLANVERFFHEDAT